MNKNDFYQKLKKILRWIMPEAAIIVGGLLLDLISKLIVEKTMDYGETITVIPKLLNFSYVTNPRAAFGTDFGLENLIGGQGVMAFFIIFTFLAVGLFSFLLFKAPKKGMLYRVSFAMIIAGALGNLYDRMFLQEVRDFIQIEYLGLEIFGSKTFAIFNIADTLVVLGTIMLIIFIIFFDKTFKEQPQTESNGAENVQAEQEQVIDAIDDTQSQTHMDE